MFDFSNQVVMVTGGSGNLGVAVAHAFFAAGASIAVVDRQTEKLPEQFPQMATHPDRWLSVGADLTDPASTKAAVDSVVTRFGRLDVLVNTVGGFRGGTPIHETPLETWDFMMNINARSVFVLSGAVIPVMRQGGRGKIIHVGSKAGLVGGGTIAAYSAAKSAMLRLIESMAAENKGQGININAVMPSTIDTPQNRAADPNADFSDWVTPDAIADVILFLASETARAVQGALVPVYGRG